MSILNENIDLDFSLSSLGQVYPGVNMRPAVRATDPVAKKLADALRNLPIHLIADPDKESLYEHFRKASPTFHFDKMDLYYVNYYGTNGMLSVSFYEIFQAGEVRNDGGSLYYANVYPADEASLKICNVLLDIWEKNGKRISKSDNGTERRYSRYI